eukprot:2922985-Rhodomonas_salina.1
MMCNSQSEAMLDLGVMAITVGPGGVCEQIATAITVGGIRVISKASSGVMLDRGRWLSPLGVSVSSFCSPATSCKFLHLPANPFHSFCYVAV